MPSKNDIARVVSELKEKHTQELSELEERMATRIEALEANQRRDEVKIDVSDQVEEEEPERELEDQVDPRE